MATTVTYKGQVLVTVDNSTKVLETSGTWCEDDFTLVDVSGGGGDDTLTKIMLSLGTKAFKALTLPEKIIFPSVTNVETEALNRTAGCKILVLPAVTAIGNYCVADSSSFEVIDFGPNTPSFGAWLFSNDSNLSTLIIRKSSVVAAANLNVFSNTPFASGGTGGTLYVPSAVISSYQSATNWSTILGYANNSIQAIEGSQYENYYADGTPIE